MLPRKSGGQLAVYALLGTVAGFLIAAAASMLVSTRGPDPTGKTGPKVLRVRWTAPEATSRDRAVFEGELTVKRPAGRLCLVFRDDGSWTVKVNGRTAHSGEAQGRVVRTSGGPDRPGRERVSVGRAEKWLRPGANTVRATRWTDLAQPGGTRPPQLLLVE